MKSSYETNSSAFSLFLFNPSSQTVQIFTKNITKRPSETAKLHQENDRQYGYRHKQKYFQAG